MPSADAQQAVDRYFQSAASYWNDIYFDTRLFPRIYRDRQNTALEWIRTLRLPVSARVLEIGCGAGYMSVALADRGFSVDGMDSTAAMVQLAGEHAFNAGVAGRVRLLLGDAHALGAADKTYDLVVALGVIPWLHAERRALQEMGRVLKDGGYLLVTADNEARLNRLLDPLSTPVLKPLRTAAKFMVRGKTRSTEPERFEPKRHYPGEVNALLRSSGFEPLWSETVGFGILTFAGKQLIPNSAGVWLHRKLQYLARRHVFPFNLTGVHYMVLAKACRF